MREALVCLLCLQPLSIGFQDASMPTDITYDAFVRLEDDERRAVFIDLSPETKATFKRERARRWVETNRSSLSARQLAAMERAISFISARLYATSPSAVDREHEASIRRELECSIGKDGMYEAFTFFPSQPGNRSVSKIVDEWLFWFENCLGQ